MKKILAMAIALLAISSYAYADKEYAQRFPTGTRLEVYTPNNPPPGVEEAPTDTKQYVRSDGSWEEVTIPAGTNKRTISATIEGNYAPPAVDEGDCVRPAYSGTITGWYIDSKVSGSIVVDVKKNGATIAGTEKPTLSSATSNSDNSLTTWTTSLTGGDQICFEVDSASTLTKANVALMVEATT